MLAVSFRNHIYCSRNITFNDNPIERYPVAGSFLQRRTVGDHRLLQTRRAALPLPKPPQCEAKIVLGLRPIERCVLACVPFQRRTVGGRRLLQTRRAALPLPKPPQCEAKIALGL